MSFKVNWKVQLICFVISLSAALIAYPWIENVFISYLTSGAADYPTGSIMINIVLQILIMTMAVSLIHELIHGLFYSLFGGKVVYGIKPLYAYTCEVSGIAIGKYYFIIVLMAPLVIITMLTVFIDSYIAKMILLFNALGCSGDIFMTFTLTKYSSKCKIIDRSYGYDIEMNE